MKKQMQSEETVCELQYTEIMKFACFLSLYFTHRMSNYSNYSVLHPAFNSLWKGRKRKTYLHCKS